MLRDASKADARAKQRELVKDDQQRITRSTRQEPRRAASALDETAESRAKMQGLMETLAGTVTPLVVIAAAVWVGLLAWVNVRERRAEIGILRAIGKPAAHDRRAGARQGRFAGRGRRGRRGVVGFGLARWLSITMFELSTSYVAVPPESLLGVLCGRAAAFRRGELSAGAGGAEPGPGRRAAGCVTLAAS